MGSAKFRLLAVLPFVALVSCNQPAATIPSGERPGLRASVRAQVQALNAAAEAKAQWVAEEPIDEEPEADVTQAVYLDLLPDDLAQDFVDVEPLYLGEFAPDAPVDPDAAAAASVDYVAQHPEIYEPDQPGVSPQQLGGFTACTRRVDYVHISRTSAARGQIIAKGQIDCNPSGRYNISARATMTLQKANGSWNLYATNSISFALSRTAPLRIPDYQYYAVGPCTSGTYRAVGDIGYYGVGGTYTISYGPSIFSPPANIRC